MSDFSNDWNPFYKYRAVADAMGRAAATDIILHNRMWWQSPRAFNDPFDCVPVFTLSGGIKERQESNRRKVKKVLGNLPRWRRRQEIREASLKPRSEVIQSMRDQVDQWMTNSAISCFSEIQDNHLMWSHYADSHRGICFCFREVAVSSPLYFYKVKHATERPVIDIIEEMTIADYQKLVMVKAAEWAYERELRMIDYRSPPGFRSFPSNMLTGVVLGARISSDDEAFILELVRKRNPEIDVLRARLSEERYCLDIIRTR